jgi:hypothetical protein
MIDGDGIDDLVAGGVGVVRLYFGGGIVDFNAEPDATLTSPSGEPSFGLSVAIAGDFNGDGYADIVVGAPNAAADAGRVHIYLGGPLRENLPMFTLNGVTGEQLGFSVAP